jgi:aquaporin Z
MSPHTTNHSAVPEMLRGAPAQSRLSSQAKTEVAAKHWPEYLMEAGALGLFMVSACVFTIVLQHPASLVRQAIGSEFVRRALTGIAMGLTAIGLIYSPFGKQSGAQMNPAVTLSFLRLGKMRAADASFYILFQCLGGLAGVLSVFVLAPALVTDPNVDFAATRPGPQGALVAFIAELLISFGLMTMVLQFTSRPKLERWTGVAAGCMVAAYITFEAPLSGMSMNPARTLASALPAGNLMGFWIYVTAPVLGMLSAAQVSRWMGGNAGCAKFNHSNRKRCIFCGKKADAMASAIGG